MLIPVLQTLLFYIPTQSDYQATIPIKKPLLSKERDEL